VPAGFLIAKATQGTHYVDPTHGRWRKYAHDKGWRFGSYCFAEPTASDGPREQARYFLDHANPRPGDLLVLDLETHAPDLAGWVNTFRQVIGRQTGARCVVYTNLSVGSTMGDQHGTPLWVADWDRPAGSPRLPSGWGRWWIHQYGGVNHVDRDIVRTTVGDVWSRFAVPVLLKVSTPIQATTPTPTQTTPTAPTQTPTPAPAPTPTPPTPAPTPAPPQMVIIPPPGPVMPSAWQLLLAWFRRVILGLKPNG